MPAQELEAVAPAVQRVLAPEHHMKRVGFTRVVVRAARRVQSQQRLLGTRVVGVLAKVGASGIGAELLEVEA